MKKNNDFLKEYLRKLTEEDFKFVDTRMAYQLQGDLDEVINFISLNKDVDQWLSTASSAFQLFDLLDQFNYFVDQESKRRFVRIS